ncbi:MAG: glycosyltransferase family 4 protein [Coleofasciculus sp. G3-WIS-01]|uniref:glycosyltransferase family 4 protein n=1 Tax=Coleofasciculus sp. G3-WIS-01 TaxID=3069528 RepID=UPI0032F7C03B
MEWTRIGNPNSNNLAISSLITGERHHFHYVPRRSSLVNQNWHNRSSRVTPYRDWLEIWKQSGDLYQDLHGGIITEFPQLAVAVGLRKRLAREPIPVVASSFNLGRCYPGLKQWLSQTTLRNINRFVVYSHRERETYSKWLSLPLERFDFIPLAGPEIPLNYSEEKDKPFILAMGSANRDYSTFFKAVGKLHIRTIVVVAKHAIRGLTIPAKVEIMSNVTIDECRRLAQEAILNIIPLIDNETAAGQRTVIDAMRMGRAVIATKCAGTEDYIQDGKTGILVKPNSCEALVESIELLFNNTDLRFSLGKEARVYATKNFSFEAKIKAFTKILDRVEDEFFGNNNY